MSFKDIKPAEEAIEPQAAAPVEAAPKPPKQEGIGIAANDPLLAEAARPKVDYGQNKTTGNLDDMLKGLPKQDNPFDDDDEGAEGEGADPTAEKRKSWYDRYFGSGDGPAEMEGSMEMDDEMYAVSGRLATEMSDEAFPSLIQGLHGSDTTASYKATPEQKDGLAQAWELYLRSIKRKLTPLSYLLYKLFIVYGWKVISGVFVFMGRVKVYGWHLPWGDSWLRKRDELVAKGKMKAPTTAANTGTHADLHQQEVERQQAQQPKPQPKTPTQPNNRLKKTCLHTKKEFYEGEGFPKKSDVNPHLVDAFISRGAYMAYANTHAQMGQQKNNGKVK